jgi:hypothetical protein
MGRFPLVTVRRQMLSTCNWCDCYVHQIKAGQVEVLWELLLLV